MERNNIKTAVQKRYAEIATSKAAKPGCGCASSKTCCAPDAQQVTRLVDYHDANIEVMPEADLGLGCGIPTLSANIKPGHTVLDLGSGAGADVFLAAKAVGPTGHVIGVDMTPEMIERAQQNASKGGYQNVEFRLGDIEDLPVDSESIDVIISNCVVNLAPDKRRVLSEIKRVLKHGGRFSISDIVTYGTIPEPIRQDMNLWTGCIAGALDRDAYLKLLAEAGFDQVEINSTVEYDHYRGDGFGILSITLEGLKP